MLLRIIVLCFFASPALAHLMPAQRATLNFIDDSAFAVIALPLSAFHNLDDDSDGAVSMAEFNRHRNALTQTIRAGVGLASESQDHQLQDIVLAPEVSHHGDEVEQLTVLGRFALPTPTPRLLTLRVALPAWEQSKQALTVTARRRSDGWRTIAKLTSEMPVATLDLGAP